ncbi:uncharacterized protein N7496_011518 [Penicillium cataractarum]|uniref:F-box domain-containing protein n=1 Tax=Penicillium cataractarum TaxID=2100454 RepID=A0A9W9RF68_9EURO|nr:uncharacterized protein N7496_011518 [Penicillium cataractarum]KAJ5359105.1 hypothetical protein N7496_011518 [Penicillium cataractarum]
MSLIRLPPELLTLIIQDLSLRDLNAVVQCSALWWAANHGSSGTLQRFIDAGANLCWESNYWSRSGAFPRAKHFRYLKFRDGLNELARHPISNATKRGHTAVVAKFLDNGVNVNHKNRFGRSPLALAAGGGHFDTVKMLLSRGACLLSVDLDGRRPITYAAREGHDDIADYLLDKFRHRYPRLHLTAKADIQILLQHAARRGNETRVMHLLFNEGAEINFQFTVESRTPLYDAVKSAPVSMVRLLLENGADPNARESPDKFRNGGRALTPLCLAVGREGSYEVIQLLLQYGADAGADSKSALYAAAEAGKSDEFFLFVQSGAKIRDVQGGLMRVAQKSECEPITSYLLQQGANPNPRRRICGWYRHRRPQPGSIRALEREIFTELIRADFSKNNMVAILELCNHVMVE